MRRLPIPFCPVATLPKPGSYVARNSVGVYFVVRDQQGTIRAVLLKPLHRGMQLADGGDVENFAVRTTVGLIAQMVAQSIYPMNTGSLNWIKAPTVWCLSTRSKSIAG